MFLETSYATLSVSSSQSSEHVQENQNDQNYSDNPDATSSSPRSVSVIASASPKYKQQNNKQQNQCHGELLKTEVSRFLPSLLLPSVLFLNDTFSRGKSTVLPDSSQPT